MALLVLNGIFLMKMPKKINTLAILCYLFFFIDLITLILSGRDIENNTIFNEVKLTLFFLPIIFSSISDNLHNIRKRVLQFFLAGVIVYILYCCMYYIYFIYMHPRYTIQIDSYLFWTIENNFPGTFHRTYVGAYIVFASLLVNRFYFISSCRWYKNIYLLTFGLLFVGIFFLGSKLTMFLFVMINIFLLLRNHKKLIIPLLLSSLVAFFSIKEWFIRSLKKSLGDRVEFYSESIKIIKENLWFGIGEKNITNKLVLINDSLTPLIPHNVFLKETLSNGIIGLGLLLSLLLFLFFKAIKINNYVFNIFLILVGAIMFIEDFIYMQRGMLFFGFFSLFLLYSNSKFDLKQHIK